MEVVDCPKGRSTGDWLGVTLGVGGRAIERVTRVAGGKGKTRGEKEKRKGVRYRSVRGIDITAVRNSDCTEHTTAVPFNLLLEGREVDAVSESWSSLTRGW